MCECACVGCVWVHVHTCPFVCEARGQPWVLLVRSPPFRMDYWSVSPSTLPCPSFTQPRLQSCVTKQRLWTQVLVFVHRALYLLSHLSNSRTLLLRNKMLGGPSHSRDMWLLNGFPAMLGLRQRLHISVKKFSTQSQGTKARTSLGFTWEYQVFLSIR